MRIAGQRLTLGRLGLHPRVDSSVDRIDQANFINISGFQDAGKAAVARIQLGSHVLTSEADDSML